MAIICLRERPEPIPDTIPEHGSFVMVSGIKMAKLEVINYSITREMAPIYALGSALSFTRDKQGIAGELTFKEFYHRSISKIFDIHYRSGSIITNFIGCELINEGSSINMNSITQQHIYNFVARDIKSILMS